MNALKRFSIFICCSFLIACDSEIKWSDSYIGSYRKFDFKYAFPYILDKKNDSVALLNTDGIQIDQCRFTSDSLSVNDTLNFKDFGYVIQYLDNVKHRISIADYRDSIKYNHQTHSAGMHRARKTPGIEIQKIEEILEGKIWSYDAIHPTPNRHFKINNYLLFKNNELTTIQEYRNQEQIIHRAHNIKKYKLYQLNDIILLNISNKDDDGNSTIFQILNGSGNKIDLVRFNTRYQEDCFFGNVNIDLVAFEKMQQSSRAFARCSEDFASEYYFGSEMSYPKGNDFIRREGNIELPLSKENGYVTFHYDLNCKKSIGNFGLEMMNLDYEEKQFPIAIVQHLFKTLLELEDWPKIDHPYERIKYKDVHGFIMFKIIDGQITDVLP